MYSFSSLLVRSFLDSIRIVCGHVRVRVRDFVPNVRDFLSGGATTSGFARSGAIADIPSTTAARGFEGSVMVVNHFDAWAMSICEVRKASATSGMTVTNGHEVVYNLEIELKTYTPWG